MEKRLYRDGKPRRCPACGSPRVASILYGLPAYSKELEQQITEKKIILGGCCVNIMDDPEWQCADCGQSFYKQRIFPGKGEE